MRLDDAIVQARNHTNEPTDLYRYYDARGNLLYVGISKSAVARAIEHQRVATWWGQWAVMMREAFSSRDEAIEAERHAILTEHPRHNIAHAQQKAVS
jgi:predicted GIY-YIG superfamily endonuclease